VDVNLHLMHEPGGWGRNGVSRGRQEEAEDEMALEVRVGAVSEGGGAFSREAIEAALAGAIRRWTRSTRRRWPRGAGTTGPPDCARSITSTTMERSSSIPTATTSRRCATMRRDQAAETRARAD